MVPTGTQLSSLKPGEEGIILSYEACGEIQCRLLEMGLIRGAKVSVKRFAPFGDPIELIVRGFHLSLRKQDAEMIWVDPVKK